MESVKHVFGKFLVLSYVYSKQPIFGLTQEWLREGSSQRQGIYVYPLCGIFYFPWHIHQIEGIDGIVCLLQKTQR